jgi:hypothetical protein
MFSLAHLLLHTAPFLDEKQTVQSDIAMSASFFLGDSSPILPDESNGLVEISLLHLVLSAAPFLLSE